MGMQITLTVNGESVTRETAPNQLLVHFIRDTLRLTGTHVGCDTTQCGACTVHVDGRAVKSCGMLTAQAAGKALSIRAMPEDMRQIAQVSELTELLAHP